jgi:hypothetical protein
VLNHFLLKGLIPSTSVMSKALSIQTQFSYCFSFNENLITVIKNNINSVVRIQGKKNLTGLFYIFYIEYKN